MVKAAAAWSALALAWMAIAPPLAPASPLQSEPPERPAGFAVGPKKALSIAGRVPEVDAQGGIHGPLEATIRLERGLWAARYYPKGEQDPVNLVLVSPNGRILGSWSGVAAAWPLARGHEGQLGHVLNAPWVWLPLCAVFLLGLLDFRRLRRWAHLDLCVLLAFGGSHILFNAGEIGWSASLAYPPLAYLLGRMLWVGFRGLEDEHRLRPSAPTLLLGALLIALVAFRITINLSDSAVIDVGHASVVGADRLIDGEPVYGKDAFPAENPYGDTYGPAVYYAYIPFEQVFPWSGGWGDMPAAHAGAIFFDLAAIAGLFALGLALGGWRRREEAATRGVRLGTILAFGWAAYPYTALVLQSNVNDTLVGALVIWGLVAFARPLTRGALIAAAALTKFAPLVLLPLWVAGKQGRALPRLGGGEGPGRARGPRLAAMGCGLAVVALLAQPALDPGLAVFADRTVGAQLWRDSPFSIWGQVDLEPLRWVVLACVAGLSLGLALYPRQRSLSQVAALSAAAIIATQLAVEHWFYFYIPWFSGLVLVALAVSARDSNGSLGRGQIGSRA